MAAAPPTCLGSPTHLLVPCSSDSTSFCPWGIHPVICHPPCSQPALWLPASCPSHFTRKAIRAGRPFPLHTWGPPFCFSRHFYSREPPFLTTPCSPCSHAALWLAGRTSHPFWFTWNRKPLPAYRGAAISDDIIPYPFSHCFEIGLLLICEHIIPTWAQSTLWLAAHFLWNRN